MKFFMCMVSIRKNSIEKEHSDVDEKKFYAFDYVANSIEKIPRR